MNDVVPQFPWSEGDHLFASALNAAIADGPYLNNAFANVLNAGYAGGADPTGVADSAPAINAALGSGMAVYMPKGNYLVRSALNVGSGDYLYGAGRGFTNIIVDQTFSKTDLGVIVLTGIEDQAPIVSDLRIVFIQPQDQGSRANFLTLAAGGTSGPGGTGIKYPPGVYATGSGRWKLERMRFDAAWDGITVGASGQPGFITEIEMGALNCGLFVGSARDVFHVSHYHFWGFGIPTAQPIGGVYFDGNTVAMDLGSQGGVNGANMTDIFCQAKVNISGGGSTWAHFVNLMMDGPNSLINIGTNLFVQITNLYSFGPPAGFSGAAAGQARVTVSGGQVFIHNFHSAAFVNPFISHTGGVLRMVGASLVNGTLNVPMIQSVGGGDLDVRDSVFAPPVGVGAWTVAPINFTGSGKCTFLNNTFRDSATATTNVGGLALTSDNAQHAVANNAWNGWGWTPPGVSGQYGFSVGRISYGNVYLSSIAGRQANLWLTADTATSPRGVNFLNNLVARWNVTVAGAAEDFAISRFNDAGTQLDQPLFISRATGAIEFGTLAAWTNNGTTAVSLTALAPAGAHATVQRWLTVTDNGGNVRYIPCF